MPSSNRSTWRLVLSYLGPLAVIPFLEARKNPDAHWHARQGVVLLLVELVLLGGLSAFVGATVLTHFGAGVALLVVLWLLWAAIVVLHLSATVIALNGGRLRVPGVSALAEADWGRLARAFRTIKPR